MKTTLIRLSLLLTLALVLAACGGGVPEAAAPDTVESEAEEDGGVSAEAGSDAGADASGGPNSLDLTDMSTFAQILGDYSLHMNFNFVATGDDGQEIDSTLVVDGVFREEPFGNSVEMMVSEPGDLGGADSVQWVEVDGTLYFYNAVNGCVVLPSLEDPIYTDFVDTGGVLTGEVQRVQPDETANGVDSYVYAITNDNLDPSEETTGDITEISKGLLYLAKDGGYVTRIYLEGRGVSEVLSQSNLLEGEISYQLDFTPEPDGVTIELPEGCGSSEEVDAPYPVMSDASGLTGFAGVLQYTSGASVNAVVSFYKSEMGALGWTLSEEATYDTYAFLTFAMGDQELGVVITQAQGDDVTVVITEQ